MSRQDIRKAQRWVDYLVDDWWRAYNIVQPIKLSPHVQVVIRVLEQAWRDKDQARTWEEIERVKDNDIQIHDTENAELYLRCGGIILEMENIEEAEYHFSKALSYLTSQTHYRGVLYCILGVVNWVRPGKHTEAMNYWSKAIAQFIKLSGQGTNMSGKAWYDQRVKIMKKALRLAIQKDQLPSLDSVLVAPPPPKRNVQYVSGPGGDVDNSFEQEDAAPEIGPDFEVAVEEPAQKVDMPEEVPTDSDHFDLNFIPPRVDEEDSDQIEIVPDLFPHDHVSPVVQDFLRILAVYEEIAASPEAAVKPSSLNPAGLDGLNIDTYIEVTQVRIGDQYYYVKSLKSSAKNGGSSAGEKNVNLIHEFPHFILRVKGNSMNQADIDDGDYVIVRAQSRADNGDIVAVQIFSKGADNKATLKRYVSETKNKIIFRPETDDPEIDPDGFTFTKKEVDDMDGVMIQGVALAVLKPVKKT